MKIYSYDAAPNAQRLNFFLKLKGIEIETIPIDMIAGEQLGNEYQSINPLGTIPALVLDDGTVLTEVIGMCVYLEELYPQQTLLGTTPLEKAQIVSWDHKLFNTVMSAVAEALRNRGKGFVNRALPGPLDLPQIPELAERGKIRLEHGWPSLEAELEGKEWLVGDSISLADLDLMICVDFSSWVKGSPPENYKNIHAHSARVKNALA
ncbi:MAG: glutathione S-transferase [Halioglobus sp.]|jgi:glutathione S-transferase